jgi:hypothetical protein
VVVFGQQHRGPKEKVHQVLDAVHLTAIAKLVDTYHADGQIITITIIRNHILLHYQIDLCKATIRLYMKRLGMTWKKIKGKKRNVRGYRVDLMRTFLVEYNNLYTIFTEAPINCPFVFVYMDESYIHRMHCGKFSYLPDRVDEINRGNNKGD